MNLHFKQSSVGIFLIILVFLASFLLSFHLIQEEQSREPQGEVFQVHCFMLGKADAFLIAGKNTAILIDTGLTENGDAIVEYLKEKGIQKLDILMISHFDKDHMGGASAVLDNFEVQKVIRPKYVVPRAKNDALIQKIQDLGIDTEIPEHTLTFSVSGLDFTVYPALTTQFRNKPSNNSSLICSIKYGRSSFLFTGDAEDERLDEFLQKQYQGEKYVVLKVPKHCQQTSSVKKLYRHFFPMAAIVTSSDEEPEKEKAVNYMLLYGTHLYLTKDGPVDIRFDADDMVIEQGGKCRNPYSRRRIQRKP